MNIYKFTITDTIVERSINATIGVIQTGSGIVGHVVTGCGTCIFVTLQLGTLQHAAVEPWRL